MEGIKGRTTKWECSVVLPTEEEDPSERVNPGRIRTYALWVGFSERVAHDPLLANHDSKDTQWLTPMIRKITLIYFLFFVNTIVFLKPET